MVGHSGTMTTPTASIGTVPQDRTRITTGDTSLQRVEVTLFWRGDAPWASCPPNDGFKFRCLGTRYGRDRWQLHLAEIDHQLPGMSTAQRRELIRAMRQALASTIGLTVLSFSSDLILEPA